jgi:tetratricopeptide (TPR) repeat protein
MNNDPLYNWKVIGLAASLVIVLVIPVYVVKELSGRAGRSAAAAKQATFVGRDHCINCHQKEYTSWRGSHHELAMAVASDSTVQGDFNNSRFQYGDIQARFYKKDGKYFVYTQGSGGEPAEFEIQYTFGFEPLQQYLIPFPGGRLQALTIAWDTERREWFCLYPEQDIPPDDWLHWTQSAQNWNGMCAECHSTNLIKNYDLASKTFSTTWSEINVSCEACHGPGSRHVAWADLPPMARPETENFELVIRTGDISPRQEVELCAPCHSRRSEFGDYDHTRANLLDNILPAILSEDLYYADGQILEEVYVYGSFVQSKMFKNDIRCSDCHNVHSLTRIKNGNDLCLQCHQAEVYNSYDHHFHNKEHEGKPSQGHLCVSCHMPQQPYMVVDWRADHSLRVPRPDLSLAIGVPNACNQGGCHDDHSIEWSLGHYQKWYGRAKKPHYGTILAAGRKGLPEARGQLIRLAGDPLYPTIVRATALNLLGRYPSQESTAAFNLALTDEDALVRHTAVVNLPATATGELVELISPLLFDPVRTVRMEAAVRLTGLDDTVLKPYQREARDITVAEYIRTMEYSLDFSFAGHNLGNLYHNLKEPDRAEQYYRSAIEIDDLFYPAKSNLALLLNTQGRNDEAEKLFREIIKDYPEQYESAYSLGLLLVEMGRLEEAVVYLKQTVEGMPGHTRAYYNLGLLHRELEQFSQAEAALLKTIELEPDNFDYLYALADFYVQLGQLQRALIIAERMTKLQPENPTGQDVKSFIDKTIRSQSRGSFD